MACVHTKPDYNVRKTHWKCSAGSQIAQQQNIKKRQNLLPQTDAVLLQPACKQLHTEGLTKGLVKQKRKNDGWKGWGKVGVL